MTVMITTDISYKELEKENILFSKISGSKINMDKTEVLVNGYFEVIPKCYIKDTIKVLGCFFGKDETQNFLNAYKKMKQIIQNWKFLKLNILERIQMLKTYVISILQYPMRAFNLPKGFDRKINPLLYPYIWNSKREKLARRIINQSYENGGLMMTDIILRNHANTLINIANIELKSEQPWAALYIYWIGITLKYDLPELAKNTWVHTIDLPKNMVDIKNTLLKYNGDKQIWMNPKNIYKYLNDKNKILSKVEKENPLLNWNMIWKSITCQKNVKIRIILYKHIYGILPTGEALLRYNIIKTMPKCILCHKGNFTVKHIFMLCDNFDGTREYLHNDLKEIDENIVINETLIRYGHNKKGDNNLVILKIIQKVFEYIYHIWKVYNDKLYKKK